MNVRVLSLGDDRQPHRWARLLERIHRTACAAARVDQLYVLITVLFPWMQGRPSCACALSTYIRRPGLRLEHAR